MPGTVGFGPPLPYTKERSGTGMLELQLAELSEMISTFGRSSDADLVAKMSMSSDVQQRGGAYGNERRGENTNEAYGGGSWACTVDHLQDLYASSLSERGWRLPGLTVTSVSF